MNLSGVEGYFNVVTSIDYGFIWAIVSIILSLAGGVLLYIFLLRGNKKFNGAFGKIIDFFTFKKLLIEEILKASYITIALFITLYSFCFIGTDIIYFFKLLIGGHIILRLSYELVSIIVKIGKNTKEINEKIKK